MKRITRIKAVLFYISIILFQSTVFSTIWALDQFIGEKMITIHKEESGQEITVKPGNLIEIELAELGSAGYRWHIGNLDSQSLELISEATRKFSKESKIGAPVMRVWCFKAKKVGQTEIDMDYYRNWEGIEKSVDHFSLKIKIINNGR